MRQAKEASNSDEDDKALYVETVAMAGMEGKEMMNG